jgi:hypothetical protein
MLYWWGKCSFGRLRRKWEDGFIGRRVMKVDCGWMGLACVDFDIG